MDPVNMAYIDRRRVVAVTLKKDGGEEKYIAKNAAMNISGRHFVIMAAHGEVYRAPHRKIEAYRLLSGNGMEFVHQISKNKREIVRVYFVQDVKTTKW